MTFARALKTTSAVLLATATLAACEMNLRQSIGLVGKGPDEFKVISNDRLQMPEDMPANTAQLPEPRPGARSLVEPRPVDDAKTALNVGVGNSAEQSAGEAALVSGVERGSGSIRRDLEADAGDSSDDPRLLQPLLEELFDYDREDEDILDPAEESRRLAVQAQRNKNPDLELPAPKEEE